MGFCVVPFVGSGVLVDGVLVTTGIHPPCVAFVVMFVEGISAVVVDVLADVVIWVWDSAVDWFLIGEPVVVEKVLVFSVLSVWLASTDPFVALETEAGSVAVAEDWLSSPLVMFSLYFRVVADTVVSFMDVVVPVSLLFSDNAVDIGDNVIADVVLTLLLFVVKVGDFDAVVCGSGVSSIVVIILALTVDLFDTGFTDVKTGAFVDVVSVVAFSDVLESDFGCMVVFSTDSVSAVIITPGSLTLVTKDVSLCVGLSVPETLILRADGFALAVLVLSVEFRGNTGRV